MSEKNEFKEKLKSLNFGIVPGGFRDSNSTTMIDRDAFLDQFGHSDGRGSVFSEERVRDAQSDSARRIKEFTSDA